MVTANHSKVQSNGSGTNGLANGGTSDSVLSVGRCKDRLRFADLSDFICSRERSSSLAVVSVASPQRSHAGSLATRCKSSKPRLVFQRLAPGSNALRTSCGCSSAGDCPTTWRNWPSSPDSSPSGDGRTGRSWAGQTTLHSSMISERRIWYADILHSRSMICEEALRHPSLLLDAFFSLKGHSQSTSTRRPLQSSGPARSQSELAGCPYMH